MTTINPTEQEFRKKATEFISLVEKYGFRPLDEINKDTIESFVEHSINFSKNKQVMSSLVYMRGTSSSVDTLIWIYFVPGKKDVVGHVPGFSYKYEQVMFRIPNIIRHFTQVDTLALYIWEFHNKVDKK